MTQQVPPVLPLAPVERIIRKAGADRVAEDAGVELAKVLEDYGLEVSSGAFDKFFPINIFKSGRLF